MKSIEKICKNCTHLFISGMCLEAGGEVGYCGLIYNDESKKIFNKNGIPKFPRESFKKITDTCSKFEKPKCLK